MGHKRTIRPNAKRLSALFMAREKMDWDTFAKKVISCQRGFMGEPEEIRPGRGEFHEYPSSCICRKPSNHTNVKKYHDEGQNTDKVPVLSEIISRNQYINDNPGEKRSQQATNSSIEGHLSLGEETDHDDPLSD